MSEPNGTNGPTPGSAPDGESSADAAGWTRARAVHMWISGLVFLVLAVVTFIAGEDNRWVSVPAAVVAAVALIDFLSINQRRRRANSE